jgi:hypothetical protein
VNSVGESLASSVARQVLLGLRESLTIANQLRRPVEAVNDALKSLYAACNVWITLTQPYALCR